MGMQWESATLPDAVSPFFGQCIYLVYIIYMGTGHWKTRIPGRRAANRTKSEDLPMPA